MTYKLITEDELKQIADIFRGDRCIGPDCSSCAALAILRTVMERKDPKLHGWFRGLYGWSKDRPSVGNAVPLYTLPDEPTT